MNKTSHQLARELLALPDLPCFHFDPSFADASDNETDETIGRPSLEVVNPRDGLTAGEIADAEAEGFLMCNFITIVGDQPKDKDREDLSWAARMVLVERARQRSDEGYDDAHDDKHVKGEISAAAASYAMAASGQVKFNREAMDDIHPPSQWPWGSEWWKLSNDPKRTLIKAAALLLAEIERLDRKNGGA